MDLSTKASLLRIKMIQLLSSPYRYRSCLTAKIHATENNFRYTYVQMLNMSPYLVISGHRRLFWKPFCVFGKQLEIPTWSVNSCSLFFSYIFPTVLLKFRGILNLYRARFESSFSQGLSCLPWHTAFKLNILQLNGRMRVSL